MHALSEPEILMAVTILWPVLIGVVAILTGIIK